MPRPRKTTEETWYDLFTDQSVEEQANMLRMLNELHRQAKRVPRITKDCHVGRHQDCRGEFKYSTDLCACACHAKAPESAPGMFLEHEQ